MQGKPRKTKEKSLDFLGFPWPIRAFSTGYGESKQKIHFPQFSITHSQNPIAIRVRFFGPQAAERLEGSVPSVRFITRISTFINLFQIFLPGCKTREAETGFSAPRALRSPSNTRAFLPTFVPIWLYRRPKSSGARQSSGQPIQSLALRESAASAWNVGNQRARLGDLGIETMPQPHRFAIVALRRTSEARG